MREWIVQFAPEFSSEFDAFDVDVQDELVAHLAVLAQEGPKLGRPLADTLKGSKYANMKELRFSRSREVGALHSPSIPLGMQSFFWAETRPAAIKSVSTNSC
jgi:hypothetical protein